MPQAIASERPSRFREGSLWAAALCALALSTPALAKKPKPGFEPALPAPPPPAPRAAGGAIFTAASIRLVLRPDRKHAIQNFLASLIQLVLLLSGAVADRLIGGL